VSRLSNSREEGQTMTEYAVILGVITPVIVAAYAVMSGKIEDVLNAVKALFG
jgi:Flp pilus assembly pilin Flp